MPTEKINYEDVLKDGTDKLNKSIENANQAEIKSEEARQTSNMALNTAGTAEQKADSVQTQFNQVVIEGDSSVEAAQARVNEKGETFDTLRDRLNSSDEQLAENEQAIGESEDAKLSGQSVWEDLEQRGWNIRWFEHLVPNRNVLADVKDWDWTEALRMAISYAQQKGNPGHSGNQYPDDSYGSRVYFPRGYYSIFGDFSVTGSGVELVGETKFATLLYYKGTTLTTSDYIFNIGTSVERIRNFKMANLTIRGEEDGTTGLNQPRAIYLGNISSWELENVDVFFLHQSFHSRSSWVARIDTCVFKHNYRSAYLDAESHNSSIRNCVFGKTLKGYDDNAITAQLTVRNSWSIKIDTCDFEFGLISIYFYHSVRGASVENSYFENNTGYALYIRDESATNDGACEGIIFEGNFVNQSGGKGVYVRHDNPNGKLHRGIEVRGNYGLINSSSYFVEDSTTSRPVVENSYFGNNSIALGLGEHVRNANSGWNRMENLTTVRTHRKAYSANSAPRGQNENISLWDYARTAWAAVPTSARTSRNLVSGVSYLVTVQLTESADKMESGLYLAHIKGTSQLVTPISPVSQGTLAIIDDGTGKKIIEFNKSSGYSTAISVSVLPLTGDEAVTEVF